ncbi:MAG: HIT domain-containing protein [Deltaproteobacteria bacterium]|nr:HIT domain-containing protein [Deltaproteobacteria bacterium]
MATVREARTTTTQRRNLSSTTRVRNATTAANVVPSTTTGGEERIDRFAEGGQVSTEADLRLRTGAVAGAGPTRTAVPDLLADWRTATLEATAHELAQQELMPELQQVLQSAARSNGGALTPDDQASIVDTFFEQNDKRVRTLARTHLGDLTKTPKHIDNTLSKVVVERRPRIQKKRDPFTPIAMNDPVARAKERVLWENPRVMVLVDLFAPCPKALVVPKKQMMFPVEADAATLAELARIAAHVSDALSDVTHAPPSGIWINPPQHLMVRQLHVHVLPQVKDYVDTGEPLVHAAANDPSIMKKADALFAKVSAALSKQLGPPS